MKNNNIAHVCTLVAKSCEATDITFTLRGIPEDKAKRIYRVACGAFRDIEITSEITGEILISHYEADDWFHSRASYGETIDCITSIYNGDI